MSLKKWFKNLITPASVKKELADLRVMLNEANEHTISAYRDVELFESELTEVRNDLSYEQQKTRDLKNELIYAINRADDFKHQVSDLESDIIDLQDQLYALENELQEARWSE